MKSNTHIYKIQKCKVKTVSNVPYNCDFQSVAASPSSGSSGMLKFEKHCPTVQGTKAVKESKCFLYDGLSFTQTKMSNGGNHHAPSKSLTSHHTPHT